ncbi:hypothetical protein ACS127_15045 [Amphibacillus sp. Q70]|uniref:hypothetical protein n=1 Tax=Amphibacillus sp. Q70 TaxID=3453416 RepID=UPI003F87813F
MKKLLQNLKNNQNGSMFIYLFYLATLLLLMSLVMINQFQNEQKITAMEIEHLHLDMLHQQTYQTLMNNWEDIDPSKKLTFQFPNGKANVVFKDEENWISIIITAIREPSYRKIKTYQLKRDSN